MDVWTETECANALADLICEAENMALTLESMGYGHGGKLCTPLARYRKNHPKESSANAYSPDPRSHNSEPQ